MIGIIIMALMGLFALIGLIAGSVKGFTKVKSWAVELILTGVITIGVSNMWLKQIGGAVPGFVTLSIAVALICGLMLLFGIFRKLLSKRIEYRKQIAYYKQYDEIEDNTEQILGALGSEDKKEYKKLTKKKFKQSGGVWSVIDRITGAVVLAVKGVVIAGFIAVFILLIVDFSRLAEAGRSLNSLFGGIYETATWANLKNYVFDFLILGVLTACIKCGYSGGIVSSLWSLTVLGLVAGGAYLSFWLTFNVSEFLPAAEGLSTHLEGVGSMLEMIGLNALSLAKIILGLIIFVFILVAIIIFAKFMPKLIDKARDGAAFCIVDGIFGAIVSTVIVTAILLVFGAVINSLYDLEFMEIFNAYFEKSGVATYFYDNNILNELGLLTDLPIKDWFTSQT